MTLKSIEMNKIKEKLRIKLKKEQKIVTKKSKKLKILKIKYK